MDKLKFGFGSRVYYFYWVYNGEMNKFVNVSFYIIIRFK